MPGTLFVVATPLGNLGDWSPRARDVVAKADWVLVEDTRVSRKLFDAYELKPHVRVFERHREQRELAPILDALREGKNIALITDAGTPAIADPGGALVDAALEAGLHVVAVPGPSILTAALSVAGVETLPVVFDGYPPDKTSDRMRLWDELRGDTAAHVFLLPPHDAARVLGELAGVIPHRKMVLCRELTKVHESVLQGTAGTIAQRLAAADAYRGEMALVVHGVITPAGAPEPELAELVTEAARLRDQHNLAGRELSDFLAFKTGVSRKTAYRAVETLKQAGR